MLYITVEKCIVALFLFFVGLVYSQKIEIRDSTNNSAISYAKIKIGQNIFYSDSIGVFNFDQNLLKDNSIIIEKYGYDKKNISLLNIKQNILLAPTYISIDEVKITTKKIVEVGENYKKGKSTLFPKGVEIGFTIKNPFSKNGLLKSIEVPVKNVINTEGFLILNFYRIKNDLPSNEVINNNPIIIPLSELKKRKNMIDLTKDKIQFPAEGFLIGAYIVSKVGVFENKISNPNIEFYNNNSKKEMYFKNNESKWIKYNLMMNSIAYVLEVGI